MGKNKDGFDAALTQIPEELQTVEFIRAWLKWCDYREKTRKKITVHACTYQFNKLRKFGPEIAVEAIELSIANDYQGLFPEKIAAERLRERRPARSQQFLGLKEFVERNSDRLNREYGT